MRRTLAAGACVAALACAGACVVAAQPALAAGSVTTQVATDLAGGPLSVAVAQQSLAYGFTLDGSDQSQAVQVDLEPSDLTGTGDGWAVTVSSSALESSSGQAVPSTWSLALNGSSSSPGSSTGLVASDDGPGTYTPPSGNTATYPLAVPGIYGGTPTPATVYTAAAGSGMGEFEVPAWLWLSAPANASAGTYSATLTWMLSQGPSGGGTGPLVPAATGLSGYTWSSSAGLVASASSTFSGWSPSNAFDDNPSTGWNAGTAGSGFQGCTSPGVYLQGAWDGAVGIGTVDLLASASPSSTETYTVCASSDGGSTWSEVGSATADVGASTALSIPVTLGDYDALRIFAVSSYSWVLVNEVTVDAVPGLSATAGNGQASVDWGAVPGASSYTVFDSTSGGAGTEACSTTATSCTVSGLTNGTTYSFWVVAESSSVASVPSRSVSATPSSYDGQVLADGAVDFWPLDDAAGATSAANLADQSQQGTPNAGVAFGQPGPIPGQTAAAFDGSGDISTPANPSSSSGFSVVAWYNLEGGTLSGDPRLVANSHVDDNSSQGGFELFLNSLSVSGWQAGTVCFSVGYTTGGTGGGTLCGGQVDSSGWHMVAATWTGSTLAIYQDGSLVGTLNYSGSLAAGPNDVALGYNPNYSGDYYTGDLADVALFGSALSASQVAQLYAEA